MEPKRLAIASSSEDSFQTASNRSPSPNREAEKDDILRCLSTIEKIVKMLKSEMNDSFVEVLENVLELMGSEKRESKLDLINAVFSNIFEATTDELLSVQQEFRKIFEVKLDKKLIVDDDKIEDIKVLGMGSFGIVSSGRLLRPDGRPPKSVAVKRSKELRYKKLIAYEASILSRLDHENILKIYAINKSATEIAIELMQLGHLVNAVEHFKFSKENMLGILKDIANGMEYLSQKKYLHRDLACRNVFLNTRKQCKIGDFSLCVYVGDRDGVYIETEHDPQGYNISPETLVTKEFTVQTDVWAMGMLVWEFFYILDHANETPPSFFTKAIHLQRFQNFNIRLPKPIIFPRNLYLYVVEKLLNIDPWKRPTFSDIKAKMIATLSHKQ